MAKTLFFNLVIFLLFCVAFAAAWITVACFCLIPRRWVPEIGFETRILTAPGNALFGLPGK